MPKSLCTDSILASQIGNFFNGQFSGPGPAQALCCSWTKCNINLEFAGKLDTFWKSWYPSVRIIWFFYLQALDKAPETTTTTTSTTGSTAAAQIQNNVNGLQIWISVLLIGMGLHFVAFGWNDLL